MGLPLAPTFANVFLCHHEAKWLESCPGEFAPVYYRRYVDDTFVLFRDKSHAPLFLNYINNKHVNINFTIETEENNKLAFLDTFIEKSDDCFNTSVYRKSTFTGLGMSYFSFCSFKFKINNIKTLLHRGFEICSTFKFVHDEF